MKAKHDPGCASRRNDRCDCVKGAKRRIRKAARDNLKRQAKRCGGPPEEGIVWLTYPPGPFTPWRWRWGP